MQHDCVRSSRTQSHCIFLKLRHREIRTIPGIEVLVIERPESEHIPLIRDPEQLQRPCQDPKHIREEITVNDLMFLFINHDTLVDAPAERPGTDTVHVPILNSKTS